MKKLILFLFFASVPLFSQFGGGSGTEADPYQIKTREHLEELRDSLKSFYSDYTFIDFRKVGFKQYGKHFKVMNDITDSVRTGIGKPDEYTFNGVFDGGGHKITLAIDPYPDSEYLYYSGLFNWIEGDAIIKNVIVDGYVNSFYEPVFGNVGAGTAGGIVGVVDNISRDDEKVGVVTIENCINIARIKGHRVGGIAGSLINQRVINCTNIGTIECILGEAGGIVGSIIAAPNDDFFIIKDCINAGFVFGETLIMHIAVAGIGGIVGWNNYSGHDYKLPINIINCINTGVVIDTAGNPVGGIIQEIPLSF